MKMNNTHLNYCSIYQEQLAIAKLVCIFVVFNSIFLIICTFVFTRKKMLINKILIFFLKIV